MGIVCAGFILFWCASCTPKLSATDYFNHFNTYQSESYLEVVKNGIRYKLQYRPKEFQAVNALKGSGDVNREEVNQQINNAGDPHLYCLRVEAEEGGEDIMQFNLSSKEDYFRRVELLNSEFNNMVVGVKNQDTTYTRFHHFERTYQLRPFVQVVFSLNKSDDHHPGEIVFTDYIFNEGEEIVFHQVDQYQNKLPRLGL